MGQILSKTILAKKIIPGIKNSGQLLELLILDRMLHGVDTVYHPTNKVPPFSKSHLIDFGFDGQTYFLKNQDHEYKTNSPQ